MSYTYLVPNDTKTHAHAVDQCQNLALILGRYIPREAIDNEDVKNERGRAVDKKRSRWLVDVLGRFTPANLDALLTSQLERWFALTQNTLKFEMRLRGRMVVGLGGKNPLEFGITLHKINGLPYIPGSALKGLARSYALLSLAEKERGINLAQLPDKHDKDDNRKLYEQYLLMISNYQAFMETTKPTDKIIAGFREAHDVYQAILHKYHLGSNIIRLDQLLRPNEIMFQTAFGTQDDAGACVFYDAVISNVTDPQKSLFTIDVMTPHFVKYYTANGTPNDGDNPNPVSYVVVREGISFGFAIGTRTGFTDEGTRKQARNWLRAGLEELGIGAKTAQGYGVFARIE